MGQDLAGEISCRGSTELKTCGIMSLDPYSSSGLHVSQPHTAVGGAVTQGVLHQLAGTKPWVRFMAVLMFVAAGLMLLGALVALLAGGAMAASGKVPGFSAGMISAFAVLYGLVALIYIYPALKLWGYANQIASLLASGSMLDLEGALNQQRAFWKFLGIMVIAVFVLYFVAIIGVVAVGGFAAMKAKGL
jgi:Family of unknown function (DUF5362)